MEDAHTWIGCSGWQYETWRGGIYPPDFPKERWLEQYALHFPTVEVNSSFHMLPRREAVTRWMEQVPENFSFVPRGSKTQIRQLRRSRERAPLPLDAPEPAVDPLETAPVLWQMPEGIPLNLDQLRATLDELPAGARHAFEFRHASWFCDKVFDELCERGVALIIGDHPGRPYQPWELTSNWTVVRMQHGHDRSCRGSYSPGELERLAGWLMERRAGGNEAWVFFSNDFRGFAVDNAKDVAGMLGGDPWALSGAGASSSVSSEALADNAEHSA